MSRRSIIRIVQVTAALSVVGAVLGGILGAALMALLGFRMGDRAIWNDAFYAGAMFGAATGSVLAPLAAWTLMRRVPIWRAIAETAVGTVGGAAIGLLFHDVAWLSPPLLGILGFLLAAIRLRLSSRVARRESTH